MGSLRKFVLIVLGLVGFSSVCIADDNDYLTAIECNGIKSEIITSCSELNNRFCGSQIWNIDGKSIDLLASHEYGYYAWAWSCVSSDKGEVIIFEITSGGNCPTCERQEIWITNGRKLSQWEEFSSFSRDINLEYNRDQYQKINRGLNNGRTD